MPFHTNRSLLCFGVTTLPLCPEIRKCRITHTRTCRSVASSGIQILSKEYLYKNPDKLEIDWKVVSQYGGL
ncbi:hypothetical protein PC119_g5418 [Phytophthora cactorum]|nr:hypothetical protein PC119_g5418 [Phytophthora cactorum]